METDRDRDEARKHCKENMGWDGMVGLDFVCLVIV